MKRTTHQFVMLGVVAFVLIGLVASWPSDYPIGQPESSPPAPSQAPLLAHHSTVKQWAAMPIAAGMSQEPAVSDTRVAPTIDELEPTGTEVSISAPIQLAFSQPMNRVSVEKSFEVRPQAEGSLAWLDDFTVRFQPVRFLHNTTYEVAVHGKSLWGRALRGSVAWRFRTVPGAPLAIAPGPSVVRVPIFVYHYVRVNQDPRDGLGYLLSVTPADFKAQMDWLQANGYHTITLADLNDFLSGSRGLPSRPVMLTFDDGYADFYTSALPVLISHDFSAVVYIVAGFIGRPGYMNADQIAALDRLGIEVGSHTVDHVDLTRQSADGLHYQLATSKQSLERLLGHPVLSFCYPYGKFDARVASAVAAAGYRDATTTTLGSYRGLGWRYTWGRIRVKGGESLWQFAQAVVTAP